ncbi:MAG: haloacid dehalogenase-like hydrolase [Candidatus Roizmanbacteria bacterium]
MKEKLAVFDVDGTLFNGNLGIEYLKMLVQKGIFKKEIGDGVYKWYDQYRSGEVEKSVAVDEIYKLYALGMRGTTTEKAREVASETWSKIKGKMYTFAPEIVQTLKNAGYLIILLSGSPIEMVQELGQFLQIERENMVAGTLETLDGTYSGNVTSYLGSAEQKIEALDKLIGRRPLDVNWLDSVGMGDDERDFGILGRVGFPIAICPTDELFERASRCGWTITNPDTVRKTIHEWVELHRQHEII